MRCLLGDVRQFSTISRRLARLTGILLVAGAVPSTLAAAAEAGMPSMAGSLLRVCAALAAVFGLFLGGVWLVRNWPRLLSRPVRSPDLQVIECRPLGGRQALWVVGYRQQRLLVASSPGGITLLTHLPEAGESEAATAPRADFAAAFQHLLGHRG